MIDTYVRTMRHQHGHERRYVGTAAQHDDKRTRSTGKRFWHVGGLWLHDNSLHGRRLRSRRRIGLNERHDDRSFLNRIGEKCLASDFGSLSQIIRTGGLFTRAREHHMCLCEVW